MEMNSERKQLIYPALLTVCCCLPLMAQNDSSFLKYQQMITNTEKVAGRSFETVALFKSREFVEIYGHPERYVDNTIGLLKKKDVTETQKIIATYGMHRLSLDAYVKYLTVLLGLAKKGTITMQVFDEGAFPTVEWAPMFYESYGDPEVNAFLVQAKALAKSKGWKDLSSYIDSALNGELAQAVKQARNAGEIPVIVNKPQ